LAYRRKIEGNFVFEDYYNYLHSKTGFMKINITLFAVIIFTLAVFTGCNKGGTGSTYYMNATIGTTPYVAANCIARPSGDALLIQGLGNASTIPVAPYISIVIANWHDAIDSFKLDSTQRGNFIQYFTTSSQYKISQSGVLVINEVNSEKISGLFQFMSTDSTQVTGGTFIAKRMP
jgi:hypothetical protein